jgi:hypothetical protein
MVCGLQSTFLEVHSGNLTTPACFVFKNGGTVSKRWTFGSVGGGLSASLAQFRSFCTCPILYVETVQIENFALILFCSLFKSSFVAIRSEP